MIRKSVPAALASLLAALVLGSLSHAAAPDLLVTRLGSDQGLSHGAVLAIVQDADGFIWFGTEDGMDRYDGYELRHFIHHRSEARSLPNNWVSALASDHAGRFWVGSVGGGVVWRERSDGSFRVPESASGGPAVDGAARVRALFVDRHNRLWVATRDSGVARVDLDRGEAIAYRHRADDDGSLSDDSVFAIAEDAAGAIWIGGTGGLDRLDPESGHSEHFAGRMLSAGVPAEALKVNALSVAADGRIWAGLDVGLLELDATTGSMRLLRHSDDAPLGLPNGRINAVLEDRDQRLWLGLSTGLALFDPSTGQATVFKHDATNPESLPDNNVTTLYQDRGGLLWIGTKTGGAARWNPRSWAFGLHRLADAGDGVTSFTTDPAHTLWIGTFGGGLLAIDARNGKETRYRTGAKPPFALRDDDVMALASDERGRIWLGTMSHGIERVDPQRGEIRHFDSDTEDPSTLPVSGVMSLLHDSHHRLWVGTYGGGLARIDLETDRVVRYAHGRDDESGLSGDRATALAEDRNGRLWIGTAGGGLNVLDPVSGRFAHFRHDPSVASSLSDDTVYAVHADAAGQVWIGTRAGGLDRAVGDPFAGSGLRFQNLSESEGLPDSTVYGIESDSQGNLWVSTNRGLVEVRPGVGRMRTFRHSHGLQGDEFNLGAHYRAGDGTLYFGGANGYNAFQPERLAASEVPPRIVLTDVVKLNQHLQSPESLRDLNLNYSDSFISLRFAALDFTGPGEHRYAYQLVGFDKEWVYAGDARQASYTDLAGGDYVFQVRAANDDGLWNGAQLSLPIHVASAPWATGWAKAIYAAAALLLAGLAWRGYRERGERQARYARRLELEVELRTAELAQRNRDMERANQRLHEASLSDLLTGLGNRRSLHDAMAALLKKSRSVRFVLMVVDLDDLKPINDTHGHEAGDAVLIEIAAILRRECRPGDHLVRWGGDEFIVMRPDADIEAASALAESICSAVAHQPYQIEGGQTVRTSCSIGFAQYPFSPDETGTPDWEETLSIADMALYEAKRLRNHWLGLAGTDKTREYASVKAAIASGLATLERDGHLIVRRRPRNPHDANDPPRRNKRMGSVTT